MSPILTPFFLTASMIVGWLERRQQEVIDYLIEQNRALRSQLGNRAASTDILKLGGRVFASGPIVPGPVRHGFWPGESPLRS